MFRAATIATIAIALLSAFLVGASTAAYDTLFEVQYVAMALIAFYAKPTQRDRSVISVLLIWAVWVLATDWPAFNFPPIYVNFEAAAFSALTLWALFRPYNYASHDAMSPNVKIGFYQGKNKHLLSSLGALIGLPFSSIAIISGGHAIRAGHGGVIREVQAISLHGGDYVFVDTGVPATQELIAALKSLVGAKIKFRTGCVVSMEKVLVRLGYTLKWYDYVPSLFYKTALKKGALK